ncbi:UNVERIFIED_CONTAM: 7-deoxyloganetin glucosyltransferase [Sesamum calycinum]|uniref:7-deoxyloganetin glucosyltransferase n=1 Tax=Sesamum calycinum TaxID=2727403 RepID=A0AAW2R7U5_9LAMI
MFWTRYRCRSRAFAALSMMDHVQDERLRAIKSSLWKEDLSCMEWLDTKEADSVVCVNFGSITVMTADQLSEFAWGLLIARSRFCLEAPGGWRVLDAQWVELDDRKWVVPVICWPFFAEQQTNCRFSCVEWGIGMEIDNNVKRGEVEALVKELMDGEKGKKMKEKPLTGRGKQRRLLLLEALPT